MFQIRFPQIVFGLLPIVACQSVASARAAYDVNAPVYPVTYTDAQKGEQITAGQAMLKRFNDAVAAGKHEFTFPPGVYHIPASGNDGLFYVNRDGTLNLHGVQDFTLRMAGVEFVMENGGGFVSLNESRNIALIGPAKIDAAIPPCTQGRILTYDPATGSATVQILPGYEVASATKGTVDAFSPAGLYLENPSWAGFNKLTVDDAARRMVSVKLDKSSNIYQPGNLVAFRIHGSPLLISSLSCNGFTIKDLDVYTEAGIGWGSSTGTWKFIHIRGIRRPGTSRLMAAGGCQMGSRGGNVTFDGCEFGNTADDLVDYGGGGLFTCLRQETPRTVVTWGGGLSPGDTLNFYTSAGFQPNASAKVLAAADIVDPAMQADAHHLVKDILKARDTDDKPLRRLTLDRNVLVSPGDYAENDSANRPESFTIRNCYFHDSGVRVMIQGFRHGLFENNTFERISGGLALTCDAWWFEGPTVQDITVRNNIFKETTFRNGWGTGKAALSIGAGWAEGKTDPALPCATHGATVTGNTFLNSSVGAIQISDTDHVLVAKNIIRRPYTAGTPTGAIHLLGVADARVLDNRVWGCPGPSVLAEGSRRLVLTGNIFTDSYKNPANPSEAAPSAVVGILHCANTQVTGNEIVGTDAASAIWIAGSAGTTLSGNKASRMTAPGAALIGTGTGNTEMQSVRSRRKRIEKITTCDQFRVYRRRYAGRAPFGVCRGWI